MDRQEFLSKIGCFGTLFLTSCLSESCKHEIQDSAKIDFTIDMNEEKYKSLLYSGNFIFEKEIIIVHTVNKEYIAAAARCTHKGSLVAYYPSDILFCSRHGASFTTAGQVIQGPAPLPLKVYKTRLNGNFLRIFS